MKITRFWPFFICHKPFGSLGFFFIVIRILYLNLDLIRFGNDLNSFFFIFVIVLKMNFL